MPTTWPHYTGIDGIISAMFFRGVDATTAGTHDLQSAYTYGSNGRAVNLLTFIAPESANLTDIWFRVTGYTGTWSATDQLLRWEVREGMNGVRVPGTTLTGNGTFSPGGTTGWKNITGLSVALTQGKLYNVIIADTDGTAINFCSIATRYGGGTSGSLASSECGTTNNGFASAWSQISSPACYVKVGTITFGGAIWDATTVQSNAALERGVRFRPQEDCTFIGFALAADGMTLTTAGHTWKVYADGVNPGGSTLMSYTPSATTVNSASAPAINSLILPAASRIDLSADTWYRAVVDPVSSTTLPRRATAGGSPDAALLAAALPMGGDYYWTAESGGAWVDTTDSLPSLGPILVPKTASASGGSLNPLSASYGKV